MKASISQDLEKLELLVEQAAESLRLDPENKSLNHCRFLFEAEHKLLLNQSVMGLHNFLDSDYVNLALFLLALEFKRAGAAIIVLKKQLQQEREPVLIKHLKSRLEFVETLLNKDEYSKEWQFFTIKQELKTFKRLFN